MQKKILLYSICILLLASCTSLKTATNSRAPVSSSVVSPEKKEAKFLDQTSLPVKSGADKIVKEENTASLEKSETLSKEKTLFSGQTIENLSPLQIKYSGLLNTSAEEVKNVRMIEFIDDWYGTPYRLGGTTKRGIDCSAFSRFLFSFVYGINLPRTAREQYRNTNRISRTELKEGDLIFFNTRGGVSHVGVYLQNNKFVHSSSSGGVAINDMYEQYWVRRFIAVGRIKDQEVVTNGQ